MNNECVECTVLQNMLLLHSKFKQEGKEDDFFKELKEIQLETLRKINTQIGELSMQKKILEESIEVFEKEFKEKFKKE